MVFGEVNQVMAINGCQDALHVHIEMLSDSPCRMGHPSYVCPIMGRVRGFIEWPHQRDEQLDPFHHSSGVLNQPFRLKYQMPETQVRSMTTTTPMNASFEPSPGRAV